MDTTSTSILVAWDEVPTPERNGIILSYIVRYQAIGGVSVNAPVYNKTVDFPTLQANLTDLIEDRVYRISVLATTSKGRGPYSVLIFVTAANLDSKSTFSTRYDSIKEAVSRFYHDLERFKNTPRSYITQQKWFYFGKHHSTNDNNPLGSEDS